ncbi:hypothetical protein TSUD_373640 [Trifolium subterraneum]|uniref:Uncharacterized protein n=1 Tax=Trifolium subterraneum TaxID=3900 RepID=A0A2Z6M798_TRISU|nr:hypothetical protein TSUD_373640 [Trifolium subterraneum]
MVTALLRINGGFDYSDGPNPRPLRALRNQKTTFHQLLLLLVLQNIQPCSHMSDGTTDVMGLIYYIDQGWEVDVAGVIANEIKLFAESGLKPGRPENNAQLGFPKAKFGDRERKPLTVRDKLRSRREKRTIANRRRARERSDGGRVCGIWRGVSPGVRRQVVTVVHSSSSFDRRCFFLLESFASSFDSGCGFAMGGVVYLC